VRSGERGIALLEAIVAIALLAGVGTALVAALGGAIRSEDDLRHRETTVLAAHRVLTAMTLLTRTDLDRRLGIYPIGEFMVGVQRPEPTLYRIAIAEARAPEIETLVTVVYRAEEGTP
jgi:type II secretory pathway pseudopilin PulG